MIYIFLDESGDLGFKESSSKWFLFTLAIIKNKRALERVIKKVWKSIHKKHKHVGELHASHEKNSTRFKMIKMLAELNDLKIMTIILNKKKVYVDLQNQKNYLYNYTANILLERLHNKEIVLNGESWAIFRKYEKGDYECYELIKNKIIDERLLFP